MNRLLIIDDIFPSTQSPFRYEEFTKILTHIDHSIVVSSGASLPLVNCSLSIDEVINEYNTIHPEFKNRVLSIPLDVLLKQNRFHLAYMVFLNNAYNAVNLLEEHRIPFVFTLYPGGGFAFNNEEVDKKLKRVFTSPCFRKVIVNETTSQNYLLDHGFCSKDQILYIPGVVVPSDDILNSHVNNRTHMNDFTISFCAYKYSPQGKDKGYDIFIETAKKLKRHGLPCKFRVIGNFDETDIDVTELGDSIEFCGTVSGKHLQNLFSETDIFLNPTKGNILVPGSFDGFPTTACVTAALSGALVMTTDPYDQNKAFTSGNNIEILNPDSEEYFQRILYYYNRPKQFNIIRNNQLQAFVARYNEHAQITPRLNILLAEIEWSCNNPLVNISPIITEPIEIPVMHCFDNNYVIPAAGSFHSMLEHANKAYRYKLYVLHTDITSQNQTLLHNVISKFSNASLEFINMEHKLENIWEQLEFTGHFSKEVMYKLLIASIFPQHEKLIITDVDVVFRGDISASYFAFDVDEDICFAGVHHVAPSGTFLETYYKLYDSLYDNNPLEKLKVCGGYLVANLKYIRSHDKEPQFLSFLSKNAHRIPQLEQDVINFCCTESEIRYLPLSNVVCSYMYDIFNDEETLHNDPFYSAEQIIEAINNPIQLHYATGVKPWKDFLCTKADEWMADLIKSGAYYEFMKKAEAKKLPSPTVVPINTLGSGWTPNNSPLTVSVLCCTYNHGKFIRDALEGIVSQKTNFAFEIIVADDASTDETRAVIEEYAAKYPHLFKCILRDKNVGIGQNYYEALSRANGKYLAVCDGDDFWIDPNKLQHQVDYMESHPDCTVCCSSFIRHEHNADGIMKVPFSVEEYISTMMPKKELYSLHDLLYCRFVASCTTMFRWQFKQRVPEFLMHYPIIDFPLVLLHAAVGGIGVIENYYPSVYNVHTSSMTNSNSSTTFVNHTKNILLEIDQYLDYRFTNDIDDYFYFLKTNERRNVAPPVIKEHIIKRGLKFIYRHFMPNFIKNIWRSLKS